jgi:hypothetical protein
VNSREICTDSPLQYHSPLPQSTLSCYTQRLHADCCDLIFIFTLMKEVALSSEFVCANGSCPEDGGSALVHIPDCTATYTSRCYTDTHSHYLLLDANKKNIDLGTGRGCPYVCEPSRLPHFLQIRLTDGSEIVTFTCRPRFTPHKHSFLVLISVRQ